MQLSNAEEAIFDLLRATCGRAEIAGALTRETKLSDLGIDSMKIIEIAFELEKQFGFEVKEEALLQLSTIETLIQLVQRGVP